MKTLILFSMLLLCFTSFAQETSEENFTAEEQKLIDQSKADLDKVVDGGADKMVPIAVGRQKGQGYVIWGYHRGFHSRSDVTFNTPDGSFTIHNVRGTDRPTTVLKNYLNPADFTKPQYNIRFGYMLTNKLGIEIGTDHMKWVADMSETYETTGECDREFWLGDQSFSIAELQEMGINIPVHLEHTDGYNYPNVGVIYYETLFKTKNNRFNVDAGIGAGAGLLVTKTNIYINDGLNGEQRHNDNNFKIAGFGAHVDTRLKISYNTKSGKQFFIMGTARGVYGDVDKAPFLDNYGGTIDHTPIYSAQLGVMGGVAFPVLQGKSKKKKEQKKQAGEL